MDDPNIPPAPAPEPPAPAPAAALTPEATPPVEPPAPAAAPEGDGEQPRDDKGRFQKRVDDLVRGKGEAEREAAYWRAQALGKTPSPAPAPAPAADAEPKADDFASYEDYVRALAKHEAKQLVRAERESARKAEQAQATQTAWQQREAEFAKTAPDYVEVVGTSEVTLPQHVLEAVAESELGPQLAYHLAKNPDVAEKLRGMSERAAMREIGRLEASITSAPAPAPAAPPAARPTNAPPPVKPVAGPGASAAVDVAKMSMDDYVKHRRQQGASWAR